jgi:ABC-type transport system involved in multi-copper enzyme maturation permease subunit
MMKMIALASVTFRELLRRKVQVNLLIFGVLLVAVSYIVSLLTLGEMHRIISDLGLSAMELIGTLLAVFLGASVVAGDVERRVIYPVVAKPVSRTQYIVGRYGGLAAALLVNLLVMAVVLAGVLAVDARALRPVDATLAGAVLMIAVQLLVVAAVAVFFSCITSTTLAAIFTLSIAMAGHLSNDMRNLWQGGSTWLPKVIWYALPNLGSLSLNSEVIYRQPVPASAWIAALYGLLYAASALAIASLAFERRDFR